MITHRYERILTMAKGNTKNRIKKMTFQKQARKFEPISEEHNLSEIVYVIKKIKKFYNP